MAPKVVLKRLTAEKVIEQVDFPVACDLCFLAQCQRKISGPKVDIYIGPKSKHYRVPKDILCYNSTYFDRCFNGQVKEAKEQKLSLPEDRPEFFQRVIASKSLLLRMPCSTVLQAAAMQS